jgi:5-hydroxyisourate hydrolase-like protein (transthyretin family)
LTDSDCEEGYECVEGECVPVSDNPPALGDGPFLAAGSWPLLPTTPESAFVLDENYDVLWTFSDDFASCSGDCTHSAEYQALGGETWSALDVTANAANGRARVTLPVESLQNATTYALRFSVTDCASQTTESNTYYFRVAVTDAPPVITGGPWLAAGTWPLLPTSAAQAMVLDQNYDVLWTFSDDYASCAGLCTHRARYRRIVDDGSWIWTWLPVTTDATGKKRARVTLPIESMEPGEYMFYFDVRDCAGQRTSAPKVYYFKVEADN